jgi:hypothetical protein
MDTLLIELKASRPPYAATERSSAAFALLNESSVKLCGRAFAAVMSKVIKITQNFFMVLSPDTFFWILDRGF